MCGFIGRICKNTSPKELYNGLPWLKRRGPDSQNLWSSSDNRVGILHDRLAIVDKDPNAHQPLTNHNLGITVAFVGEIYNYRDLKQKFSNYSFKTKSDTEVILASYLTHGLSGLSLLKGMYSLVIVDERKKRLILARDPIGKKPLFIARWRDDFLFGSTLISLVAVHKKPVALNSNVLEHFWKYGYILPHTTALLEAVPVLPGQVLEFNWFGKLVTERRCEPDALYLYDGEPLEKVIETVGFLLTNAVFHRLADNPNPIALLSGGIDSTIVTSIASKICLESGIPLQVLTLGALIPGMYDEKYAHYAASRLKTPLKVLRLPIRSHGESIIKSLDLQDEPLGMLSYFAMERLANLSANYGRILLSGDGGDEVFLGYGNPADWYNNNEVAQAQTTHISCGPKLPPWMSTWAQQVVTDDLVGHMFTKADRASAEQGVELRCPLLDWDLMSYTRSLPFEILVHGQRLKALLKDQLNGWPKWFLERKKIGFAFNLRWLWGLSRYSGLREAIDAQAIETFNPYLPNCLRCNANNWKTLDIFQHFTEVWRLLSWSRFIHRLDEAQKCRILPNFTNVETAG